MDAGAIIMGEPMSARVFRDRKSGLIARSLEGGFANPLVSNQKPRGRMLTLLLRKKYVTCWWGGGATALEFHSGGATCSANPNLPMPSSLISTSPKKNLFDLELLKR
ncbi:hypothetical protein J6590_090744 [Homalodisca vitripennis]|nr:hypothetical protein J6590_090744 [Homalodisca vitripennis]